MDSGKKQKYISELNALLECGQQIIQAALQLSGINLQGKDASSKLGFWIIDKQQKEQQQRWIQKLRLKKGRIDKKIDNYKSDPRFQKLKELQFDQLLLALAIEKNPSSSCEEIADWVATQLINKQYWRKKLTEDEEKKINQIPFQQARFQVQNKLQLHDNTGILKISEQQKNRSILQQILQLNQLKLAREDEQKENRKKYLQSFHKNPIVARKIINQKLKKESKKQQQNATQNKQPRNQLQKYLKNSNKEINQGSEVGKQQRHRQKQLKELCDRLQKQKQKRCLQQIATILRNIIANFSVDKYRSLNMDGRQFSQNISYCGGGIQILHYVGFKQENQTRRLVLSEQVRTLSQMKAMLNIIEQKLHEK